MLTEYDNLNQLCDNFNDDEIYGAYQDGSLEQWLSQMYYEKEAVALKNLSLDENADREQIIREIKIIFGILIPEKSEKELRLSQFTKDQNLLKMYDSAAFNQRELARLLKEGKRQILLVNSEFNIPMSVENTEYTVVGNVVLHPNNRSEYLSHNISVKNFTFPDEKELHAVITENPEIPGTPNLTEMFMIPAYSEYISLEKGCIDNKEFSSESECREYIRNKVTSVYNEADKYLDPSSSRNIAKKAAEYYSEALSSALKNNLDTITALYPEETVDALNSAVDCKKLLKEKFTEELCDEYYRLYDLNYFIDLPDIDSYVSGLKYGIFYKDGAKDIYSYYCSDRYVVHNELERDLNEMVDFFYKNGS